MRLGDVITQLEAVTDKRKPVVFRTVEGSLAEYVQDGDHPGDFFSYRGYYERLALDVGSRGRPTAAAFLALCQKQIGQTYEGYKGGSYTMDGQTLVHVAPWGQTTHDRIVAVSERTEEVVLLVAVVAEW